MLSPLTLVAVLARMEPGREGRPVAGPAHGREVGRQRVGGRSEPDEKYFMMKIFKSFYLINGPLLIYLYKCPTATETHGKHIFCLKKSINLLIGMNLVWNGPWLT